MLVLSSKMKNTLVFRRHSLKRMYTFHRTQIFYSFPLCLNSTIDQEKTPTNQPRKHQKPEPKKEKPQFSLQMIDGCYIIKGPNF